MCKKQKSYLFQNQIEESNYRCQYTYHPPYCKQRM